MRLVMVFATAVVLNGCQRTETPQQTDSRIATESDVARAELASVIAGYERWLSEGNLDSAGAVLDDNYRGLAPNMPAIVGRQAWIAWFGPQLKLGRWNEDMTTESVVANGPIAIERGRYVLSFTPAADAPRNIKAINDTGKYISYWRKTGGEWVLKEGIWNSDKPVQ